MTKLDAEKIAERISNVCADNLSKHKYDDLEFQITEALTLYGNERFKLGLERAAKESEDNSDYCDSDYPCGPYIATAIRSLALEEPKK